MSHKPFYKSQWDQSMGSMAGRLRCLCVPGPVHPRTGGGGAGHQASHPLCCPQAGPSASFQQLNQSAMRKTFFGSLVMLHPNWLLFIKNYCSWNVQLFTLLCVQGRLSQHVNSSQKGDFVTQQACIWFFLFSIKARTVILNKKSIGDKYCKRPETFLIN